MIDKSGNNHAFKHVQC